MANAKSEAPAKPAEEEDAQRFGAVAVDPADGAEVIVKPESTELHDSQVRAFARTRGLDLPTRGRLSAARAGEIKKVFADEWDAATGVFDRRIKRLQNEWDKATASLVPYTADANASTAPTQEVEAEVTK
jgi:hypothetical protein